MKHLLIIAGIVAASVTYAVGSPKPQHFDGLGNATEAPDTAIAPTAMPMIESVSDFFLMTDEFATIDPSVRLDMLDYYASGMRKHMSTRLSGEAVIDSIADGHYMRVTTSSVSETEVWMYAAKSGNKVFAVVNRVKLPAVDCRIRIVKGTDDGLTELPFAAPTVNDFLTANNKKQREDLLSRFDFPLIDYHFLPDGSIEARLSTDGYLSREDAAAVAPYVKQCLTYAWDGKNLKLKK